jgi:hypothetical protein
MTRVLLAVCVVTGSAFIAPGAICEDDFESYPVGANIGGTNGWSDSNTTADQGFTVSAAGSFLGTGAQSMHFTDTTTNGELSDARLQNVFPATLTSAAIHFDFMAATSLQTPVVTVRSGTNVTSAQAIALTISPGGAGYISYHDGAVWQKFAAGLKANIWYHFVLLIPAVSSHTFDLIVLDAEGEVVNEKGLSFRTAVPGLAGIDFATNSGFGKSGGDYCIDNFQVLAVPAAVAP